MRVLKRLTLALPLVAILGCADRELPTEIARDGPSFAISDATHGGTAGFYWLPPMVPNPGPFSGTFDGTLSPVVTVCAGTSATPCASPLATFSIGSGPAGIKVDTEGESYGANWHTKAVSPGSYRVRTYLGSEVLGFIDVQVVKNKKDLARVQSGFFGVVRGDPVRIKFRIESMTPAVPVDRVEVSPSSAEIEIAGTEQLTATAYDAQNNVLSCTFTWSSSDENVATVDNTGLVTGVAAGTATITASCRGVEGTAQITVTAVSTGPTLRTWTGAISTNWSVAGNWDPVGVPTTSDAVLIPDRTNDPVLTENVQIAKLTVAGGVLNNKGFSLKIRQAAP